MAEPNTNKNTNAEPITTEPIGGTQTANQEPQTYSKDYVKALRDEAKGYRITRNEYGDALRGLLGVDSLDDLNGKITAFNDAQTKKLKDLEDSHNAYIIDNELSKALGDSYNEKLARKLLDRSSITVTDSKVEGLTEALKKLEEEYPEIKKTEPPKTADGTGTGKTTKSKDDEALAKFRKALGLK